HVPPWFDLPFFITQWFICCHKYIVRIAMKIFVIYFNSLFSIGKIKNNKKLCPAIILKCNGVFVKETNTVKKWFFLSTIYKWYCSRHCLCKDCKRGMNWSGKSFIIRFVPTIFIMIAGKIEWDRLFRIDRIIFILYTVQCKSRSSASSYSYHFMKHFQWIIGIKTTCHQI